MRPQAEAAANITPEATRERPLLGRQGLASRILDRLQDNNSIRVVGKVESTQELAIRGVSRSIPRTDIICGLVDPCYDLDALSERIGSVFDSLRGITQRDHLSPAAKDAIEPSKGARQFRLTISERVGSKRRISSIIGVSVFPDREIAQSILESRLLLEAGVQNAEDHPQ